jgi:hypothetical protein
MIDHRSPARLSEVERGAVKSSIDKQGVDRAVYHMWLRDSTQQDMNYSVKRCHGPDVLSPAGKMIRIGNSPAFFNGVVSYFTQTFDKPHSYCTIELTSEEPETALEVSTNTILC